MSTDLDAAVARLEERCRHGELRRVGVVSADVRLLLADWKRRGKDAEYVQNAVDTVVHYRNLAIKCGASPDDMLGVYDRKLCVDHNPDDRDGYDFSDNRETWAEVEKVTAERDAARAELARLRERDARVREAFRLIDWMAKEYAEAGGSGGPEMRAYNEAIALLKETP